MVRRVCWAVALACLPWAASRAGAPPLSAYAALPAGVSAHLSPDGSAIAMIGSSNGKPAFLVERFDGSPMRVFSAGSWAPQWIEWKGPNLLLAGVLGTTANWNTRRVIPVTRLLVLAADGSRTTPVDLSFASSFIGGEVTPNLADRVVSMLPGDPDHVLMATLDTTGPTVSRIDVRSGSRSLEQDSLTGVFEWYADAKGVVRAAAKFRRDPTTGHRPVVDLLARVGANDSWRVVLSEKVDGTFGAAFGGFDPNDADRILLGGDGDHDNRVVRAYSISTGRPAEIVAEVPGADVLPISRNRQLIGYRTLGRSVRFTYLLPDWQHDAAAIAHALGGGTVELVDRTADGRQVLARLHDDSMPIQYWLLSRSAGKTSLRLIANSYEGITASQVAEQRWLSYTARDGRTIPALLTLPPAHRSGALPFVVMPHGGPSANDEVGFDFMAQFVASRGYGVLQPQFRGSTGFGRALFDAGHQEWGGTMQDDITDGAKYLISQHLADPSRIAVVGASFGGYAALEGVVRESSLYRAAAALAPVSDLPMMFGGVRAFARPGADLLLPAGDYQSMYAASPVHDAARITVPVLLVHGERDFTVPVQQSETMQAAMKRAGKPVEAIYMESADHYLESAADRTAWLSALDGFLSANLGRPTN